MLTAPVNCFANLVRTHLNCVLVNLPIAWQGRENVPFLERASVESPEATQHTSSDGEQKKVALSYVNQAWAEARFDGVDDDCMAMSCLFAAFAELVGTYGEEAAAKYADSLSNRIRAGEFTLASARQ